MSYDITHPREWYRIKARLVWRRMSDTNYVDPLQHQQDKLSQWYKDHLPVVTVKGFNEHYYHIYFRHERDVILFKLKFGDLEYNE